MSDILVTGATGFLGKHLLDRLDAKNVRVLVRKPTKRLARLGVEVIKADLLDEDALAKATQGVRQIYHCAGLVSRNPDDAHVMYRVHVDGTRAVLQAAAKAKVARVVVASTSGTVACSTDPDRVATEEDGYATEVVREWPYYLSKIYQEQAAFRLGNELGLEVVCINPSLLLGPGDARQSSTGDVLKFLSRSIPVVPSGGINFVDARDAAEAAVLAMAKGRAGQRYLVGGPNWTFAEFFGRLARLSKVDAPRLKLPARVQRVGAVVMERLAHAAGREPKVDAASVDMAQCYWYLDASRARRELGWEPRDPQDTLFETIQYLRKKFIDTPDAFERNYA